ncbi:MAG: hypothetical protein AAFO07_14030 [Bacteroidota bacterium]
MKYINSEKTGPVDKEKLWCKINPDKPYDDVRFRKYTSDLLKLLEGFLSQQIYERDPAHQASFLIEAVGEKKLEKLYKTATESSKRVLNKHQKPSSISYYHQYKIERNLFDLTDFEIKRADKSNVEEINRHLDIFYLSEKLKFYNYILSQKQITQHKYEVNLIEPILKELQDHMYLEVPLVSLYFQACLTLIEPENEQHFQKLKLLLKQFSTEIPEKEARDDLYNTAQNYCIIKMNQGNQAYLKELFTLFQDMVNNKLVIANEKITPWYYRNIVTVALRLGEYDWIEKFIEDFKNYLSIEYRENAYTFSKAQLYFYRKDFDKVIQLLREVEYDDFTYNLNSKVMLLFTYYETDEIEPLYSLFDSFRVYLNRSKKIPDHRKETYKNLIKYTKKLTKVIPSDNKSIEKLKIEIESNPKIASKSWLKQKIAELEN